MRTQASRAATACQRLPRINSGRKQVGQQTVIMHWMEYQSACATMFFLPHEEEICFLGVLEQ